MFVEAKDDAGCGDNWITGTISRAKLQSNHHHQQTNIQFFYRPDALPVTQPTDWQQCQSTEGEYHIPWTCYPKLTWGLPTLSLTTNSSWLPWERVAMPVISPLMPVPHVKAQNETCIQDERPSTGQASAAVPAGCRVAWSKCLLGCGSCTDRWVLATTRSLALHSPSLVTPSHCTQQTLHAPYTGCCRKTKPTTP